MYLSRFARLPPAAAPAAAWPAPTPNLPSATRLPPAQRPGGSRAVAPRTRDGKAGFVYKLGNKNGKANIDEYAPIYTPDAWKVDGDKYEPGLVGLAAWAATLGAILLAGAFAIYTVRCVGRRGRARALTRRADERAVSGSGGMQGLGAQ